MSATRRLANIFVACMCVSCWWSMRSIRQRLTAVVTERPQIALRIANGEFVCAVVGYGQRSGDVGSVRAHSFIQRVRVGGHNVPAGRTGFTTPLCGGFVAAEHDTAASLGPVELSVVDGLTLAVTCRQDHPESVYVVLDQRWRVV